MIGKEVTMKRALWDAMRDTLPARVEVSLLFGACLVLLLVSASSLRAQISYGSIVGTVTDSTNASVPDATVTVTNIATGERRTQQTGANGNYDFDNLLPGNYRVDIEKAGFKRLTRNNIELQVQATVRVDGVMQVGEIGETVQVSGTAEMLQTDSSSLGAVVGQRQVLEMPLNGRNPLNLVTLVPGVVAQGSSMTSPTGQNIFSFGNYQISGAIAGTNAFFYDGIPINFGSLVALVPTQDAVQEFKVQSNDEGPEFGRFEGGVINLVSKSGTNDFHGSAYEYLRNKVLNANAFFSNAAGLPTPAFTQNQYGVNVGGPIKKDKIFFFAGWEGFDLRYGVPFTDSVPTLAQRQGDFSQTYNAAGQQIPIYDPLSTCGQLGNAACTNGITRTQFPGNIIPASRLSPTALVLANYWGKPNVAGAPFTNVNNFSTNADTGGNNDQVDSRLDYDLSDRQRLFLRYTYWTNNSLAEDPYNDGVYFDRGPENWVTNAAAVGDTITLSPTTIVDLRIGFERFVYGRTPKSLGVDLTTFGLPAALNNEVSFRVLPTPNVSGFSDLFSTQGAGSVIRQENDGYFLYPTVTKTMGSHTIKFGGEVRREIANYIQSNVGSGYYSFDNLATAINPQAPKLNGLTTGLGFASFMLGDGSSGNVVTPEPYSYRDYYGGLFLGDTWQANRKLTVNAGIRWELPMPEVERYNRMYQFLAGAPSPIAQAAGMPNLKGTLGLVDSSTDQSRYAAAVHLKLFAPRFGLAYRLTDKTVIRAGYGIFFPVSQQNGGSLTSITQSWVPTINSELTPLNVLSNPFPTGIIQPPGRSPDFQSLELGEGISAPIPGPQEFPYVQQWNFTIQRELLQNMTLEVAYAGAKGTHLLGGPVLNELPNADLALGAAALTKQVPNPFYGLIPYGTLSAATVEAGQLLLPYPQYTSVTGAYNGNRDYDYDALQVKFQKRFGQGGTILAAYTWSKNIGDIETGMSWLENGPIAGIQDNNNLNQEKAVSGFNVPQNLVISYVYDLPFGKGKHFLSGVSGVTDKLISGWEINGISIFQSGFPLTLTTSSNLTDSFGGGSRPNYVGGCDISESGSATQKLGKWFNTACFTAPPAATFGNLGRTLTAVSAQGIANYDFSIVKSTMIKERVGIQFRTEFFNLFNRVQFGPPGEQLGNPQFGVISSTINQPRLIQFALRLTF